MRILFISGTSGGGAARSTFQLANRCLHRGHEVSVLVPTRRRSARTWTATTPRGVRSVLEAPGRGARELQRHMRTAPRRLRDDGVTVWGAPFVERAARNLLDAGRPDVVVCNSLYRRAWKELQPVLGASGVPSVFYLRDETELENLDLAAMQPDLLLANAQAHAARAAEVGLNATVIPSVIDLDGVQVESTREVALFVNPTPSRGLDLACEVAHRCGDVPFAFQESSHGITERDRREIRSRTREARVEIRSFRSEPALVYADARVLFVPYLVANRPRVILEAHANGIPVLAANRPGLEEAVGPGGLLVDAPGDPAGWVEGLRALWDDADLYQRCSAAARAHSRRPDVDPEHLTTMFLGQLGALIE